jgi:NAD(P)-dependent dehydrogenase (short-subunit alcohol dehydrogenase family)
MTPAASGYRGRVAIVTGAAMGIGRATTIALADDGYNVVAADILEGELRDTVAEVSARGGTAAPIRADVGDVADVERMVTYAVDTFGRLDAAVNNAAISQKFSLDGPDSSLVDNLTPEEWDRVLRVNLNAVFYCSKFELGVMRRQRSGGSIVNLSSSAAALAIEGMAAYVASKMGVIGLTRTAAIENADQNIRVNAVMPGNTRTSMSASTLGAPDEFENILNATTPLNRAAEPSEVADAIVWLCGDSSSYVTGHTLVVDGGSTIKHPRSGIQRLTYQQ